MAILSKKQATAMLEERDKMMHLLAHMQPSAQVEQAAGRDWSKQTVL